MWNKPPIEIPGKSIGEPKREGTHECPHCHRSFENYKIKGGDLCCPKCGKVIYKGGAGSRNR